MFVVVFEVEPKEGREQDYLDLAAQLKPEVEQIDGFISVERFKSMAKPGRLVSVSYWRDEDAVKRWREHNRHHLGAALGPRSDLRRLSHHGRRGRAPIRHVRARPGPKAPQQLP